MPPKRIVETITAPAPSPKRGTSAGSLKKARGKNTNTVKVAIPSVGVYSIPEIMAAIDNRRNEIGLAVPDFCKDAQIDKSNYYKLLKGTATGFTVATLLRLLSTARLTLNFGIMEEE